MFLMDIDLHFVIVQGKNIARKHQSARMPEQPETWKPNVISAAILQRQVPDDENTTLLQTTSDLF